jgi:hypothetical protein
MLGRWLVNVEHGAVAKKSGQPVFVGGRVARLGDSVAILAEDDYGNRHLAGAGEDGDDGRVVIGCGGQGVGIDNHWPSTGLKPAPISDAVRGAEAPLFHDNVSTMTPAFGPRQSARSAPEFAIDLLEGLCHALLDLLTLFVFAEVFELAQMFRPGFFLRCDSQLLLDSLSHELAQRNTALGSHRLGPAEEKIRNLEGCFH